MMNLKTLNNRRSILEQTGEERLLAAVFDGLETDCIPCPDVLAVEEWTKLIMSVISTLTEREQKVLHLLFGLEGEKGQSLQEVAKAFGITCERTRQIKQKALRKLRHPSRADVLKIAISSYDELEQKRQSMERELFYVQTMLEIYKKHGLAAPESKDDDRPIEDLDLSARTYTCLTRAGFETIGELRAMTEDDLIQIRNLGHKGAEEIAKKIQTT